MTNLLLALALASTPPGTKPPVVALPLQTVSAGQIVVPVTIGKHAGLAFLLDTGASGSLITPETAHLLGSLPRDGHKVAEVVGAGGSTGNSDALVLQSLSVGARHYSKLTVVVSPIDDVSNDSALPGPLAGILGRDFLEQSVMEIDFPARMLRLFPRDAVGEQEVPMSRIPLKQLDSGLLGVVAVLDSGAAFTAVVDIGAGASIVNGRAANWKPAVTGSGGAMAMGLDGSAMALTPHRFTSLAVGGLTFGQPTLFVGELPVFQALGLGQEPAMILGMDLLAGRVVRIDFKGSLLSISAKM